MNAGTTFPAWRTISCSASRSSSEKSQALLPPGALQGLEEHTWPGNVRELENVVQRAVVLAEGQTIEMWHLPVAFNKGFEQARRVHSYEEEVREFKRRLLLRTLPNAASPARLVSRSDHPGEEKCAGRAR